MQAEMSQSLPFLMRPSKLDKSMAGDVGFDPFLLSDQLNLEWMRAAELKNGRVAMLAVVGWLVTALGIHLPGRDFVGFEAVSKNPLAVHLQIIAACGMVELANLDKDFGGNYVNNEIGNYGFDPLNFSKGKSQAQMDDLRLKEVKNGRLAMIAIIGLMVQSLVFPGKSPFSL